MLTPQRPPFFPFLVLAGPWEGSWDWPRLPMTPLTGPPQTRTIFSDAFKFWRNDLLTPVPTEFFKDFPSSANRKSPSGGGFYSFNLKGALGSSLHLARTYIPEGRSGFQQERLGLCSQHPTFTGFLKKSLGNPQLSSCVLTRTWLLGENGNSCGEGRREELCTNNHTQAVSAPLSRDLNCRPFRKRKTGTGACGGGVASCSDRFSQIQCAKQGLEAASEFTFILSGPWACLWFHLAA